MKEKRWFKYGKLRFNSANLPPNEKESINAEKTEVYQNIRTENGGIIYSPIVGTVTIDGKTAWFARTRKAGITTIHYLWPIETRKEARALAILLHFSSGGKDE